MPAPFRFGAVATLVRQRTANPRSPVRVRAAPLERLRRHQASGPLPSSRARTRTGGSSRAAREVVEELHGTPRDDRGSAQPTGGQSGRHTGTRRPLRAGDGPNHAVLCGRAGASRTAPEVVEELPGPPRDDWRSPRSPACSTAFWLERRRRVMRLPGFPCRLSNPRREDAAVRKFRHYPNAAVSANL